ncbi:MAG: SbcC/MukB-like Walker B domain-containing protein, partial [Methanoregulaceae archaeon]
EEITQSQRITDLCEEKTRIETRLKELQKEEGHTAQLVKLAEEKSVLQARVESLEEERKKLVSGEPCPLCGSPDHPWRTGTIPVPDTLQRDLETFRTILMDLTKKIRENEKRHAAIDAEIKGHASEQEKLSTRITTLTTELQKKSIDLDLTLTGSDPKTVIPAALAECTAQLKAEQEILVRAETKEKQIRVLENRVNQERQALAGTRNESAKATNLRDSQNKEKDRISGEITKNNEEYEQKKRAILDTLQDYGDILVFSPGEMEQVLPELRERKDLYTKNISRKQKLEKELDGCDGELKTTQALLAASEEALGKLSEILSRIQETMSTLSEKRRDQYGEKDPAAEETRIIRLAEEAEKGYTLAAEAKTDADSKKNAWEGQIRSLTDRIAGRCRTLGEQEQVFARGLAEAGFPDESRFNAAQIPDKKLSELEEMENTLRREDLEIASGLREKTAKFAGERERALTTETREKLAEEIGNLKNQTIRLQIDIGGLRTKLEQYDEQLVKFQALTDEITKQKKECAKWQNLHDLIGSADGKKFRIFAQGLTFENLVVQANRHLRKMSDRYLLVRNRESPLDLDIQDNYQAGEIRTTKNLSGGERFLVSLALALGLSGMASRNIRIDSLFLDEGFGTLDDTTLETALETLSSLQREGKIIGIISHVPALKERIAVQIQVEKIGGGRSRLSGPGCSGPD